MSQILEFLVLSFATVGLVALGRWIFRSGWGNVWKTVGAVLVVMLWWAMVNGPLSGRWGADHGPLTDLIATFGIVLAATWGIRRVGNDWIQQTAVVATAFAFLIVIWVPRLDSATLNPPSKRGEERVAPADDDFDCSGLNPEQREMAGCPD